MSWLRFSDSTNSDRKWREISEKHPHRYANCWALWTHACLWAARCHTDGHISARDLARVTPLEPRAVRRAINILQDHDLLTKTSETAYAVPNYLKYNPSRAQVEQWRRAGTQRTAACRARATAQNEPVDESATDLSTDLYTNLSTGPEENQGLTPNVTPVPFLSPPKKNHHHPAPQSGRRLADGLTPVGSLLAGKSWAQSNAEVDKLEEDDDFLGQEKKSSSSIPPPPPPTDMPQSRLPESAPAPAAVAEPAPALELPAETPAAAVAEPLVEMPPPVAAAAVQAPNLLPEGALDKQSFLTLCKRRGFLYGPVAVERRFGLLGGSLTPAELVLAERKKSIKDAEGVRHVVYIGDYLLQTIINARAEKNALSHPRFADSKKNQKYHMENKRQLEGDAAKKAGLNLGKGGNSQPAEPMPAEVWKEGSLDSARGISRMIEEGRYEELAAGMAT